MPDHTDVRSQPNTAKFPIVGVGASAGGVEALSNFVAALPAHPGVSIILVLHLPAEFPSMLADVLGRLTTLPVRPIRDGEAIERDVIHVLPSGSSVAVVGETLHLSPRPPGHDWHPVDVLFRSLADEAGERAIAVVLSGTGTNGSAQLGAIKAASGLVMVQDLDEAAFKEMPRNALATGQVDRTATCAELAAMVGEWGRRLPIAEIEGDIEAGQIEGLLDLVRAHTGRNFANYKRGTMQRRIHRRASMLQQQGLGGYLDLCRNRPQEVELLSRDLLIGVTGFFRDRPTWTILEQEVLPDLISAGPPEEPFRVWIAGCSTGEEAYSMAIAIQECQDRNDNHRSVQIFATDLNLQACEAARQGVFEHSALAGMGDERLSRHFIKDGDRFRAAPHIRDVITFAQHNLLRDPPFSQLDLISCRNVLIYLDAEAQEEILGIFHFGLRRHGLLMLGSSETVGRKDHLFSVVDDSHRFYRRLENARSALSFMRRGRSFRSLALQTPPPPAKRDSDSHRSLALDLAHHHFSPAFVLVDERFNVCYHSGPTEVFLHQPEGERTDALLTLCDPIARPMLQGALAKTKANGTPTTTTYLSGGGGTSPGTVVEATVHAVLGQEGERLYMVSFRERLGAHEGTLREAVKTGEIDSAAALTAIDHELRATREEMSTLIEELETSNEELKASNEEVRSMYEELQAANEELETSREELVSVNEELLAVNKRLQGKLDELAQMNDVLSNLLSSTDLPTVFLDRKLCIQRFTPAAGRLMHLIAGDVGRPYEDLNDRVSGTRVLNDARKVLATLVPIEGEIRTADGSHFMLRTHPYRTAEDRIEGVVITLTNIDQLKRAETGLRESEHRYRSIFDNAAVGIAQLNAEGRLVACNQTLCTITALPRHLLTSKPLREFVEPRSWTLIDEALHRLAGLPPGSNETVEVQLHVGDIRPWLRWTLSSLGEGPEPRQAILIVEDISDRRHTQHMIQRQSEQLKRSNDDLSQFASMASHDLQAPLRVIGSYLDMIVELGDKLDAPQQRRYFQLAVDNVHIMRRMITDMLEYSRCELGDVPMEHCSLGQVVGLACANLDPQIALHKADIVVGDLPTVIAPARLMLQLFQNLIDNGIKYRRQETPRIEVGAARMPDAWRITVTDNGRGIPEKMSARIFDLFDRGMGGGDSGSGIGLAICRKAVERIGGQIWLESRLDQGTTFHFTIPDRSAGVPAHGQ